MKKRFDNWLTKHLVGVFLTCLAFFLVLDAYCIMRHISESFVGLDYIFCAINAAGTILYLIATPLAIRRKNLEKATKIIFQETEKYFFHGFKLRRYVCTSTFWRFQEWLGSGRCYGLSILAMIMLKRNKTAILYRGDSYDKDGNFQTRHSWAEFKIPFNGWWVLDFAWISTGFSSKRKYFKAINAEGGTLQAKWSCTYDEFWDTPFVIAICESMKTQNTSNIYKLLGVFGSVHDKGYGFPDYCYSEEILQYATCRNMIPFYDCDKKPISSRIIRDFVKNPKRKQPKASSVRLAHSNIRKFEKWKAKQKQPAIPT